MKRINITLDDNFFGRLKIINREENKGLLKEGTFAKKIVRDYIDNKLKNDFICVDGLTFQQEELFKQKKKLSKGKAIKK